MQRAYGGARPTRPATATTEGSDTDQLHAHASAGTAGSGGALPHGDAIQTAFGRHDVSGVQAHTDGAAQDAAAGMGAEAFASGNDVAFGSGSPSLHTAAHEAAHIVQQRAGVQLAGGVGQVGDQYEKNADAVADAVVAGQSAEGLLDPFASDSPAAAGLQAKAVQRSELETAMTTSQEVSDGPYGWTSSYDIELYDDHCMITIGVNVTPDAGVTPQQVARVQTITNREFQRHFDNQFVLRDATGATRQLRMQLDFSSASPHLEVALHAGAGRDDLDNWFVTSQPIDRAHELGHQLGLRDEYVDATVPNRANAAAAGVQSDHSLMGNYYNEGIAEAGVRGRHGDQLAGDLSAATGQVFTAERSPTYTVRRGDTLGGIALRVLGSRGRWREIHQLNSDQISDPNLIMPGWELNMP